MFLLRACLRHGGGGGRCGVRNISANATPIKVPSLIAPRISSPNAGGIHRHHRPFSSSGGGGGDDNDKNNDEDHDKRFFLKDEDSLPAPPSYVRDAVTGKWTNETRTKLSAKDRKLLNLDDDERGEEVMARMEERWEKAGEEAAEGGEDVTLGMMKLNEEHERVARRIQEQRLALGTIGRDPADGVVKGGDDDEEEDGKAPPAVDPATDRPLSPREYQALKTYAEKERGVRPREFARLAEDDPDLIPHNSVSSGAEGSADPKNFFDADLDLAYLNPRLNRKAFDDGSGGAGGGGSGDDPFADLLPSDLNPARKVNRRNAKPIPKRLLHHNNLSLLRRYTTPGGKIMNRVQSRLGAKDQRKISKLVKRARHLGLIPHLGQWKFEDHGNLHEPGFQEAHRAPVGEGGEGKRDWEVELEGRGLWPLADETEVVKRFYNVEGMMDHIAGKRGTKKRRELEELLGGAGALVPEEDGGNEKMEDGRSST